MNAAEPSARRRFWRAAIGLALLHFLALLGLMGLIFFASHIPPKAVNLDGLILALVGVEEVLVAPRKFLLRFWPGEATPRLLRSVATLFNSAIWGVALAGIRALWRKGMV